MMLPADWTITVGIWLGVAGMIGLWQFATVRDPELPAFGDLFRATF